MRKLWNKIRISKSDAKTVNRIAVSTIAMVPVICPLFPCGHQEPIECARCIQYIVANTLDSWIKKKPSRHAWFEKEGYI